MLRSMTGFGKSAAAIGGRNFSVEIRSLNSKYLDLNLKIPAFLREKELEIRSTLSENVLRGKVELVIEVQSGREQLYSINKTVFKQYYIDLELLAKELNVPTGNLIDTVMNIPDVVATTDEKMSEADIAKIDKLLQKTLKTLDEFRCREGKELETDMLKRIQQIKKISSEVLKTEHGRKEQIKERLKQKLEEVIATNQIDQNRLEQEVLFYAERLDITEELVRLKTHCDYFVDVTNDKEISKGKKLGFLAQEIGREINTMGAKANDAAIQKQVIEMKDELEKIKEQVNNVL